jgi:hypothetical protein
VAEIKFDEAPPEDVFEVPEEVQAIAQQQLREVEIKEPEEDPNRPRLKRRKKR